MTIGKFQVLDLNKKATIVDGSYLGYLRFAVVVVLLRCGKYTWTGKYIDQVVKNIVTLPLEININKKLLAQQKRS